MLDRQGLRVPTVVVHVGSKCRQTCAVSRSRTSVGVPSGSDTPTRRALRARLDADRAAETADAPMSDEGRLAVLEWVHSGRYRTVVDEIAVDDPELAG